MPSSVRLRVNDPDELRANLRPAYGEYLLNGRGTFVATVTKIDLQHVWMQRLEEILPRTWHIEASAERFALIFAAHPVPAMRYRGAEMGADELMLRAPGADVWHNLNDPSVLGSISLPRAFLYERGRATDALDKAATVGVRVMRVGAPIMSALRRLHSAAADLAATAPERIENSGAAAGLEESLSEIFLDCLTEGWTVPDRAASRRHDLILRRFRRLIEGRDGEPLYLSEVCATLGVSSRTLHVCCVEAMGYGPKRYLTLRRLHLARRALRAADRANSVTDIATRYGFWELGRFAVTYRALFGEAPSETLRAKPR
ncbi:MAG TPA: helix-turn-helix domain-containing protein [Acetobacteraceae bacterium]|nr:helix-turn-helix domain-containing protein [Acetobacteraceae bacterium]